jgi:hypothetical protein
MNAAPRRTTSQRDHAARLLMRLTLGTAIAGSLGTVAFGGVAAVAAVGDQATSSDSTASDRTTSDSSTSTGLQPAVSPPSTASSGSSQVSTGGS